MKILRRYIAAAAVLLLFSWPASADKFILKSGAEIEGDIVERTDSYTKVDIGGTEVTVFNDEIAQEGSAAPSTGKHFLWKASSGSDTCYILGSVHFAKKEIYPLDREIEGAFDRAGVLAVEVDVLNIDPVEIQRITMESAVYPPGRTLKQEISADVYNATAAKLKEFGLDMEQFEIFKPWLCALTIIGLEFQKLGFNPEDGVDMHFLNKARGVKKIVELETFDFQVKLLNSFSDELQELFLSSTILELSTLESEMGRIMDAWLSGDTRSLEEIMFAELSGHPEFEPVYEKMFFERNKNMASRIEGFLNSGETHFVIVGAGHLVGERGIVKLLEQKGYGVEQL
ncbi:MAG: TraB/GumN family protein [Candidatus Omnitrophica bacterium]|nr:TraB/GumN family protein [Candidatus Omnitrophota bacterium]